MNFGEEDISNKSSVLTLVLLMFFGRLGAHRFYVGKYYTGALFLIVGISSIFADFRTLPLALLAKIIVNLIILVDLYALFSDSFTDKKGKLVIGEEKALVYDTEEERTRILFTSKLNNIMIVLGGIAVYILYYIIIYIVL